MNSLCRVRRTYVRHWEVQHLWDYLKVLFILIYRAVNILLKFQSCFKFTVDTVTFFPVSISSSKTFLSFLVKESIKAIILSNPLNNNSKINKNRNQPNINPAILFFLSYNNNLLSIFKNIWSKKYYSQLEGEKNFANWL